MLSKRFGKIFNNSFLLTRVDCIFFEISVFWPTANHELPQRSVSDSCAPLYRERVFAKATTRYSTVVVRRLLGKLMSSTLFLYPSRNRLDKPPPHGDRRLSGCCTESSLDVGRGTWLTERFRIIYYLELTLNLTLILTPTEAYKSRRSREVQRWLYNRPSVGWQTSKKRFWATQEHL